MYISPRALEGGRRHRLAVGTMLFLCMSLVGVGLSVSAVNGAVGELARAGLVAGAVSMFAVAWWCARYWYAAFCQGRRAEPVPDPNPWPWVLPWTVAVVALFVTGVRQLVSGDHAGWFSLGGGTFMTMPLIVGGVAGLWGMVRASRRRTRGPAASSGHAEQVRARRDWGPIG